MYLFHWFIHDRFYVWLHFLNHVNILVSLKRYIYIYKILYIFMYTKYCGIELRLNWFLGILQNNMGFPTKFIPRTSLFLNMCPHESNNSPTWRFMSFSLTYYIMYTLLFQWHEQYQTMDAQFCYKYCNYEKADQVCNETKRYHHILNVPSLAIRATIHQTIVSSNRAACGHASPGR